MGASSLVAGDGLTLRGEHFGFGPLFPAMLAAIICLAGSVDAAYDWFKVRERVVLRPDGRARVPPRATARLRLVGRGRGGAVRHDPVVHLGRDRDDRKPVVPGGGLGPLRDRARAGAAERAPPARRPRGGRRRVLHATAVRRPVRDVDRGARHPLADRAVGEAADAGGPPPLLADGVAARARHDRLRREARLGRRPHRARSARMRCSGAATTRSTSESGSSTTSATSPSTSPSFRSRSRRSCSGRSRGPGERDPARRPPSWRCSPPPTSSGSSSSPRSRAARSASTGSTTATGSTSSRSGSSGSSSGSTPACRARSSRPRSESSRRSRSH